jgi:prepilin-type N-terminal cleavage/methylation domain-containing protein
LRDLRGGRGFTLIELGIAIAIIALLVVAVMQSSSLIGSAGSKSVQAAVKDLATAIRDFRDRYGYLPGDMPNATAQIPGLVAGSCSATDNGDGNGQIDAGEVACVYEHLSRAGFIKGGTGAISLTIGTQTVTVRAIAANAAYGFPSSTRNVIELLNLPCQVALELDSKVDDGNLTAGTARALNSAVALASCIVGGANDPVATMAVAF